MGYQIRFLFARVQVEKWTLPSVARDLPDRIVGATAIALQIQLISRDGKIRTCRAEARLQRPKG
jgi:PIN domain nuclease of toxin-antitoxin system